MHASRSRRIVALAGVALLLALTTAGCGRRAQLDDPGALPTSTPVVATAPPTDAPASTAEAASPPTQSPADAPAATPVPTPNLDAIQALINDIDADLGADATATTDEGSPQ
jgi:hypothetical protein